MKFSTVDAPAPTRLPNPFDDVFPTEEGKAVQVALPGKEKDETDDGAAIRRTIKQARESANHKGFSVRVVKAEQGTKAKPETSLTFYTRPKITRPRKAAEADK